MPYAWTEPELVLEHQGVCVYHTYKNGFMDSGWFEYHYITDVTEQEEFSFDIRDLPSYQNDTGHTEILKQAIERKEIKLPE